MTDQAVPAAPPGDKLAYLFGADDQSGRAFSGTGIHSPGNTDVQLLRSGDPNDFVRLHIPANFLRLKVKPSLQGVGTVLNLITDPDMNPRVLELADRFLRGFKGRVINPPAAVLSTGRDRVARLLDGIDGLVAPRVARFAGRPAQATTAMERAGMSFPAILRETGTHNGRVIGVLRDRDEVLAAIRPDRTYFLTQFVNTPTPEGHYHKIRIYFFGAASVIRHCLLSDHWSVHGADRERFLVHHPDWIAREKALVSAGPAALPAPARRALAEVRARMPLDFFGMDFAVLPDGRALLFEANATMNFFPLSTLPQFAYASEDLVPRARAAFDAMLGPAA